MSKNVVFPFLTLQEDSKAVRLGEWYFRDPAESSFSRIDLARGISGWSYFMPLSFSRKIDIDGKALIEELELGNSHPEFIVVFSIRTGAMGNRRVVKTLTLKNEENYEGNIEFSVESTELCEQISLITSIVLGKDIEGGDPWIPRRKGSRLWGDEARVILEGSGNRFPMRDIEFSSDHNLPHEADWHLDWRPDLLHYSFSSAVSLLINSEHEDFLERLQKKDEIVLRQLMAGVISEIGTCLISLDTFTEPDEPFQEGSLGAIASAWMSLAFPNSSLSIVQSQYRTRPNFVQTRLRSLASRM